MNKPQDKLGVLGEIAWLINSRRFDEADEKLKAIEADRNHEAWRLFIVCMVLRDRINKEKPPCSTPS